MADTEASNEPTILHYLNEDCWRALLDYVPVNHIIQSERVSRQWQAVILAYLQRIRIGVERPYIRFSEAVSNVRRVTLWEEKFPSFWRWTHKLGPSVVATYCKTEECLETITKNCPKLEALTFMNLPEQQLQKIKIEHFKYLQRIRLICCSLSDDFISQFIANKTLEELEIWINDEITGRFLLDIELTSLKSLHIFGCHAFESRHLVLASIRLGELRRLVLRVIPEEIYKQIHLVLRKTPKLEYLHIFGIEDRSRLFEAVCRLGCLRHLSVSCVATDADVEDVARCCKELRSLELVNCDKMSASGVLAACRQAGARLTSLGVHRGHCLTDDNVVDIVQLCPTLTLLDLESCFGLSRPLAARAAAARRAVSAVPLRFRVPFGGELQPCDPELHKGIILDFSQEE